MAELNHLPLSVRVALEEDNPSILRLEDKCIKCGMCKDACTKLMSVHDHYTLEQTGGNAVCSSVVNVQMSALWTASWSAMKRPL